MITGAGGFVAFVRGASPGSVATVRLARTAKMPVWLHIDGMPGTGPDPGTLAAGGEHGYQAI
jgi:hypothetical protein